MARVAFIDESKARDYLLVAAVVDSDDLGRYRQAIRALCLPGQPRVHMKKESDSRRRQILSTLARLGPVVTVYRATGSGRTDLARRDACIRALVEDAAAQRVDRLTFERDETLLARDRQCLIELTRRLRLPHLEYVHDSARAESLLSVPDAIAWAWARGGDWPRRCSPVVVAERLV
jgi:hypothetical protein